MAFSKRLQQEIITAERDPDYSLFSGDVLISEDDLLWDRFGNEIRRYEELENDAHVSAVLSKRKYAVTGREWMVENPDPENPDNEEAALATYLCRYALKRFDFDKLCYDLLNAILIGKGFAEIFWDEVTLQVPNIGEGTYTLPYETRARASSRFAYAKSKDSKIPSNVESVQGYELRHLTRDNPWNGERIGKYRIIPYSWGSKTGNPNGNGLGKKIWWPLTLKKDIIKFWGVFLDRYSAPIPWGEYPEGGSKQELEQFLSGVAQGSWAALPKGYNISLLEASRSSSTASYEGFVKWADDQISQVVLGETLTTSPQAVGGSEAATRVHNDVRIEIAKADADLLSGYLQKYLLEPIVRLNIGPKAPVPNVWRLFTTGTDLQKQAGVDSQLNQMGFRRTFDSVTEVYGDGYEDTQVKTEEGTESLESILSGFNSSAEQPSDGTNGDSEGENTPPLETEGNSL